MRRLEFVIIYVLLTDIYCKARLWIEPDQSQILLAEGDKLRLDCKHEYSHNKGSMGTFKKGGNIIPVQNANGYVISMQKQVISMGMRSTITLGKEYVTVKDSGIYSCVVDDIVASVSVVIVKVVPMDGEITDDPVEVSCSFNLSTDLIHNASWTWIHGDKILQSNKKYTIINQHFNGILQINNSDHNDIGKYECLLGNYNEIATRKSTYTYLKAKPIITKETIDLDHGVKFICKASGYPRPNIVWTKNNVVLNSSKTEETEIYTKSFLYIEDINAVDNETYACTANNDLDTKNAEFKSPLQLGAQSSGVKSINELCCSTLTTLWLLTSIIFINNIVVCS